MNAEGVTKLVKSKRMLKIASRWGDGYDAIRGVRNGAATEGERSSLKAPMLFANIEVGDSCRRLVVHLRANARVLSIFSIIGACAKQRDQNKDERREFHYSPAAADASRSACSRS